MSDAGDEIPIAAAEVEVTTEAPVKGKLSVEEALQVRNFILCLLEPVRSNFLCIASSEERPRPRRSCSRSP